MPFPRAQCLGSALARPSEGRDSALKPGATRVGRRVRSQSGVGVADAPSRRSPKALRAGAGRGLSAARSAVECAGKAFGRSRQRFEAGGDQRGRRVRSQKRRGVADAPSRRSPKALRAGAGRGLSAARSAVECAGKAFGRRRQRFEAGGDQGWTTGPVAKRRGVADAPSRRSPKALRAGAGRGLSAARSAVECAGKAYGRPRQRFEAGGDQSGRRVRSQSGVGVADSFPPQSEGAPRGAGCGLSAARSAVECAGKAFGRPRQRFETWFVFGGEAARSGWVRRGRRQAADATDLLESASAPRRPPGSKSESFRMSSRGTRVTFPGSRCRPLQ